MLKKILPLALIATLSIGFNSTFAADLATPKPATAKAQSCELLSQNVR
jgi:hypothetical protein